MNEIRKKLERITQCGCGCGVDPEPLCACWDSVEALRLRVQGMKELAEEALATLPPEGETRANLVSNRKLGQLLELIDKLCRLGNGEHDGNSIGNQIAQEARAILLSADPAPSSEKALREALRLLQLWYTWQAEATEVRMADDDYLNIVTPTAALLASSPAPEAPKEGRSCANCGRDCIHGQNGECTDGTWRHWIPQDERSATT